MRDNRCNESLLKETIDNMKSDIETYKEVAKASQDDAYDRIFSSIINMRFYAIKYEYILEISLNQLYEEYLEIINDFKKMNYLVHSNNIVDILSLGILFEDSIDNLKRIVELADDCEVNDITFDYLVNGCGLKRNFNSKLFKHNHENILTKFIQLSKTDNKKASEEFVDYIENKFPKIYWGEDWTGQVNDSFLGITLFSYTAIAKILKLDDSLLKNNPHYCYDLSHYKNEMEFSPEKTGDMSKIYKIGISEYRELEKLIPIQFHEEANEVFIDHKTLSDEDFYKKYDIESVSNGRLELKDYIKLKNEPYVLGFLLVCKLLDSGYLIELDSPEEIIDYEVYNFWKDITDVKVKAVMFDVDNGSYYITYIPEDVEIDSILDIKIRAIRKLEEFNDFLEYFETN